MSGGRQRRQQQQSHRPGSANKDAQDGKLGKELSS